ncbi:MAG: hypothetical protein ABIL07_03340 [candidate division WOR-3 bacterium]
MWDYPILRILRFKRLSRHSIYQLYLTNFYYKRNNPYSDGELIGHLRCDLAARIVSSLSFSLSGVKA